MKSFISMNLLEQFEYDEILRLMNDLERIEKKMNESKLDQLKLYFKTIYDIVETNLLHYADQEFNSLIANTRIIPHSK